LACARRRDRCAANFGRIERLANATPLERLGTPEDIAAAIAFLAGPDGG
jgi:NAD(P)-dependent dehydrogenase (short-subunit alcohol dehydrogenase family)